MALPDPPPESIRFLGIDEFAFRRGRSSGTIVVNWETRHVVGLLPDCNAETAAAWMRNVPELMAISRDRGGEYAAAAVVGAPQALQPADRFHLSTNLGETVEAVLSGHLAAHRNHLTESYSPTFLADPRFNQPPSLSSTRSRAEPGEARRAEADQTSGVWAG